MFTACGTWHFGLQVVGLVCCGAVDYVSGLRDVSRETSHKPDTGTIMPIMRSSRFIQMFAACGTWHFGLQVVGLVCCGTVGYVSGLRDVSRETSHKTDIGSIMPIMRSSRFIQMFPACGTWRFGLQVVGLVCCGAVGYVSGLRDVSRETSHKTDIGSIMPIMRSSRFVQMFAACGTWRFGLQVVGLVSPEKYPANRTHNPQLHTTPDQRPVNQSAKYHRQQPLYNTLELLMMGVVVPETCKAASCKPDT